MFRFLLCHFSGKIRRNAFRKCVTYIWLVKPDSFNSATFIANKRLGYDNPLSPRSYIFDLLNNAAHRNMIARSKLRDVRDSAPIFIASREMPQKVTDGRKPKFVKPRQKLRPNAVDRRKRSNKRNHYLRTCPETC